MTDPARVRERFVSWVLAFQEFEKAFTELNPTFELDLDLTALYHAAHCYFQDIERYKLYHFSRPTDLADDIKKAAFAIYWLVRYRPIMSRAADLDAVLSGGAADALLNDPSAIVNVEYALNVAYSYLGYHLHPDVEESVVYLLQYRAVTAEALITIFSMMAQCQKLGTGAFNRHNWKAV